MPHSLGLNAAAAWSLRQRNARYPPPPVHHDYLRGTANGSYHQVNSWRRDDMKRVAELILYPILAISALVLVIYLASLGPATNRVLSIFLGLAGIATCCYVIHWLRYPGIYKTKSAARWLGHIGLATLLLVLAPLVAVLHPLMHLSAVGHFLKLSKLLGLDFRFEPGERVRVRADAPAPLTAEKVGSVSSVRSVRLPRGAAFAGPPAAAGAILYAVLLDDGSAIEIAEQFLEELR